MIEVELPDGSIAEFPDDTPKETIKSAIAKKFPPAKVDASAELGKLYRDFAKDGPSQDQETRRRAAESATVEGAPIVGPTVRNLSRLGHAAVETVKGNGRGSLAGNYDREAILNRVAQEYAPDAAAGGEIAGNVAGSVAGAAPLAATKIGASALGMSGPFLQRILASAASSGAISGADAAIRGKSGKEVAGDSAISAGVGALVPVVGQGLSKAASGLANSRVGQAFGDRIAGLFTPAEEGSRRLGRAIKADARTADVATPIDEMVARETGVPLMNVDRGGEATRGAARAVANADPEFRNIVNKAANDRFSGQGQRFQNLVRRIVGGGLDDDVNYIEGVKSAARTANKKAYDAAGANPRSLDMWDDDFARMMESDAMQVAARGAEKAGSNRAVGEGIKPIQQPFEFTENGVTMKQSPGAPRPTLAFWNQTKINLDKQINQAKRAGDTGTVSELMGVKKALTAKLDSMVPEYAAARKGAAAAFGAEDAVEAGQKFVTNPRDLVTAAKNFDKFSSAEKAGFRSGYASELIRKLRGTGENQNVVGNFFRNEANRDALKMVFGPEKARALEAYARVERLADGIRGALGNSTTVRQLVELGIVGGGTYAYTGDLTKAGVAASVAAGGQRIRSRQQGIMMQQMGKLLLSSDPADIAKAVKMAEESPSVMKALDSMGSNLARYTGAAARAGAVAAPTGMEEGGLMPRRAPLEITVGAPRQ